MVYNVKLFYLTIQCRSFLDGGYPVKRSICCLIFFGVIVLVTISVATDVQAEPNEKMSEEEIYNERLALYLKYEALTMVPWYYLAAVDQFERNVVRVRPDLPKRETVSAIHYPEEEWVGLLNPLTDDDQAAGIAFFDGIGLDGD